MTHDETNSATESNPVTETTPSPQAYPSQASGNAASEGGQQSEGAAPAQLDSTNSTEPQIPQGGAAENATTKEAPFGGILPEALSEALTKRGFSALTSIQQAVAEADTSKLDLRISSQTGSGKTVAVGIAIARQLLGEGPRERQGRVPSVLVLTPTRELAGQVRRELDWLLRQIEDATTEVVTGGTSVGLDRKNLSRGPRVLVGTPGRVLDHLNSGALDTSQVSLVVLDEADQMLDMGFREELENILEKVPSERRTHLVSATFAGEVLSVARKVQREFRHIEGSPLGQANDDITHVAHVVSERHKCDALINVLLAHQGKDEEGELGRVLVFTRTRADTTDVAERLQKDGFRAEPLSGEMPQASRTRTLEAFRRGRVPIIVATDVAARGLDVSGVTMVVHFDPPGDADALTHRSGRTGRAGQKGTSVLFLPPQARRRVERLLSLAKIQPQWSPVPTPDKIKKLFVKQGRRKVFARLNDEPDEGALSYARKLLEELPADRVIAALLSFAEEEPPCTPRETSFHLQPEHTRSRYEGRERKYSQDAPRGRGAPPRRDGGRRPQGSGFARERWTGGDSPPRGPRPAGNFSSPKRRTPPRG